MRTSEARFGEDLRRRWCGAGSPSAAARARFVEPPILGRSSAHYGARSVAIPAGHRIEGSDLRALEPSRLVRTDNSTRAGPRARARDIGLCRRPRSLGSRASAIGSGTSATGGHQVPVVPAGADHHHRKVQRLLRRAEEHLRPGPGGRRIAPTSGGRGRGRALGFPARLPVPALGSSWWPIRTMRWTAPGTSRRITSSSGVSSSTSACATSAEASHRLIVRSS